MEVISLNDQLRGDEATEMKVTLVQYIEEEVPMNEDWYMVGIVADVLCELMLSLYFGDHVNISWSTSWTIPGSWLSCHLARLVRLSNRFVFTFGLDLGRMSCSRALFGVSEELPVVNNSYTSINHDGKNLHSQKSNYYQTTCADRNGKLTRKVHF